MRGLNPGPGRARRRKVVLPRFAIILALLLSACADDVRGLRLAEVDLSDGAAVRQLGRQLSPADSAALITYAALHAPSSPGFCGKRLLGPSGQEPATIGEAIDFTRERAAAIRTASLGAERPKSAAELAAEQWDGLIVQRELLVSRQSVLLSEHGPAAKRLSEWASLEARMAEYDSKLAALKPKMEAGATS
jgi:hypothetical protein